MWTLVINSLPGILFNYSNSPFCKNGGTSSAPSATIGGIGGSYSGTAGLVFANTTTGTIDLNASTAGTYNVTYTVSIAGCGNVTSTVGNAITINSLPGTSISYAGSPYCNNVASANVTAVNTVTGGIFTAPAGLTINSITGLVTPTSSTQGTYTVTYNYTIAGCGALTTTTSLRINSVPGLLFGFTGSPYCNIGTATPTTSGFNGGGFSSASSSLVFTNTVTGIVNLASSTAGTYPLTYTVSVPGCGNISSTVGSALTINSVPGVNISYVSPVCNTSTISGVTALNTVSGGIYSATGGLTINPTNGTVNPSGFGGTYTITYSYTIAGCGPQSTTTSLVVTTLPSTPTLSYGAAPYCSSSSPISLVSSTNALNGSFFSTATGFSVNATNGQITIPQNTLAGVFVVRYDIPAGAGCASVTGNNTITLSGVPNVLTITNIPATQCYNAQVVLNATGTIPGASIQWLQDGVAVGTNSAVYTTTGLTNTSYTYVAVLNNGVCTTVPSAPMVVNVNVNPTVTGISSSQSFACSSQSVTFNNTGLVGSIVYAVNTGTGFNVLPSNIYTFTNTIVGNAFSFVGYAFVAGCQTVTSTPIIVNSSLCGLTAAFASNPTPICLTNASSTGVTFTNTSSSAGGTILGYVWNFGANATPASTVIGINSTSYTINVTYSAAGPKTITLSILGTGGLTSTISGSVQVDALSTISAMSIPVTAICETNTSSVVSVTALGNIQWYKAGVAQGTAGLQVAGAMTSNTTFIATAVNGVCPMVTATGVVTVTNLNVGGSIAGASPICASSSGLNLTVTSQVGNSYTWYNSTNSGTTWNALSSNVNTIATGTLSTTTSYVVSVTGGACPNVASGIVNINVTPTPIAGTSSVDRMIVCTSDGNGGIYTLANSSGTIQWERSLDLSSWANAAGAGNTTASLTANVETVIGPKYFRARVTNGGACGDVYSNVITVTASSCGLQAAFTPILTTVCVSVGNTVRFTDASTSTNTILGYTWDFAGGTGGNVNTAGPHDITFGTSGPKNVRLTILGLGGLTSIANGSVTVDGTSLQGSISSGLAAPICYKTGSTLTLTGSLGAIQWYSTTTGLLVGTTSTLGTGNLTASDGYFTTVKNGVCPMLTTSGVSVAVHPQSNAGTITSNAASVCQNLTATLGVTGNTGTIYQWQSWNGSAFVNVPNATLAGFTTSALTNTISGTYQYRLEVKSGINACTPAYSNTVTVDAIVCSLSANVTVNGTLLPTAISLQNASGTGLNFGVQLISGTVVGYNWSLAGAGTTSSAASTVNTGYATPGVYNVLVTVIGVGNVPFPYLVVITIDGMSLPGTITGNGTSVNPICYNTNDVLTLSGFVGNAIQWYNSSGIIVGANAATYTTPNLTANETYFATVRNGVSPMVTATGFIVNVRQQATSTGVNIPATLCIGTNASITATGILGTVTGWESSADNSSWSSTALTGNPTTLVSLTDPIVYYRPLITNGIGCTPVGGNSVLIDAIGCTATVSFTGHPLATQCVSTASVAGYTMVDATISAAPKLAWAWNFGSGANPLTATTSAPGVVTYSTPGAKQITLTVTIAGGNVFTSTTTVGISDSFTLDGLAFASSIVSNSTALCSGNSLNLSISGVPTATTYAWERAATNTFVSPTSLGSVTTAGESMPIPTGTSSDYFYRLGVTNGACLVTNYSNVITVSSTLQPSASISYTLDNCKGNVSQSDVLVTVTTVAGGSFPYSFSSGSLGGSLNSSSGLISIASAPIGNHVVTLTASAFKGCNAFTTTTGVNINQNPTASFSYPNASYCENYGTVPVALFNTSGTTTTGNFFSNSTLVVNATNGEVTTNNTTPSNYSVFYALNATAGCPASTSSGVSFTIRANPVANTPTYSNNSNNLYCNIGTSGDATSTNAGGSYASSPSVAFSNASTGNINLASVTTNSIFNIRYVINATPTCAAVTSTGFATVSVNPQVTPSISYANSVYCYNNSTNTEPASVNPSGGTFAVNGAGFTINNNRQVVFGNSIGKSSSFTVSYTTTVPGCTSQTITTTGITVVRMVAPTSFGYTSNTKGVGGQFCNSGADLVPTFVGSAFDGWNPTFSVNIAGVPSSNVIKSDGTIMISKLPVGSWTVTYTDNVNNCGAFTALTAVVNVTSSGVADIFQTDKGVCDGSPIVLVVDPQKIADASTFVWSEKFNNGVTTLAETTKELNHTMTGSGLHTIKVSVTNGQCLPKADSVNISVDAYPEAGVIKTVIPGDTLLCYEPTIANLTIIGFRGNNFIWEYSKKEVDEEKNVKYLPAQGFYQSFLAYDSKLPSATSPAFNSNADFTSKLYIRAKVYNGVCTLGPDGKDVYTPVFIISKCPKNNFIPNALTPGSADGNSFWDIQKLRLPDNVTITIFNRYGVEVYSMTGKDLQTRTFDGDGLPAGTYYYLIDYKGAKTENDRGDLTIIR
ncbi:MAG: hypothetical protein EAZ53_06860 [Bacteroidetes bacterium]|nr:MAG: hypothetical protein EAZ53_06860 [Bacteroidota bacterium]